MANTGILSRIMVSMQPIIDLSENWMEEYNAIRPHDAL